MKTFKTIREMKEAVREVKAEGKTVGFVPTMGFLHEGHLSLVRESLKKTDVTVVSIFVNPTQFGANEDFNEYPRDLRRDTKILEKEGIDYLFVPQVNMIYPEGYKTYVEVIDLQDKLCGLSRPGHFRGVCMVVLKLFNIVQPDVAFFGQKDAQQAILIKRMVKDLNLELKIEVLPIIREKDGLALSSRNTYLNPKERKAALVLSKSLKEAEILFSKGERESARIIARIKDWIAKEPLAKIDYVEIVSMDQLNPIERVKEKALVALAVFIGKIRLIDNTILQTKE